MLIMVDIWDGFITTGFMTEMGGPSSSLKILPAVQRDPLGQQDQQEVQEPPDLPDQQGKRVQQNLQDH